jgi:hypothetical protein
VKKGASQKTGAQAAIRRTKSPRQTIPTESLRVRSPTPDVGVSDGREGAIKSVGRAWSPGFNRWDACMSESFGILQFLVSSPRQTG